MEFDLSLATVVSIHAPAGGATHATTLNTNREYVSIHAPAGGATKTIPFKSMAEVVSIHAPAGGATFIFWNNIINNRFQSTRPRGARRNLLSYLRTLFMFQSTRPRGARHSYFCL